MQGSMTDRAPIQKIKSSTRVVGSRNSGNVKMPREFGLSKGAQKIQENCEGQQRPQVVKKESILTSRSSKPREKESSALLGGDPRSRSGGSSANVSMLFLEQQADEDDHVAPRNKIEFYQSTKPVIKKTMTGRKAAEAKAANNQKNKLNNDL